MPVIEGYNFTVDLQDRGMVKTLRLIKSEARALKAVMRSDFAEMKNNEGNLAAYTARLKDAESVVNKYSEAIRRLKKENEKFQSAERNGTLSDAQKSNWARNINTIERYKFQIANLSAQMNKDRFTIERLKIGVDTLRKSTEAVTTSTKAYSSALREQGKFYQAERANATGLKAQRAALQAQMRSEISATTVLRNKQAGLVNEYNIQKGKLASYTASLARANAELTKNTAEYGKNNVKTQISKASVDVYRKSIEETRGKIAGLSERIGKNSTTLANQAGEAKKTASSLREVSRASRSIGNTRLGSIYKAGSAHLARFNSALKESTAHTRKWWQESRNAFTGVGVALGGVAFEAGRAIKSASDIQKKYVEVGNLLKTSGESAAEATSHVNKMQKQGVALSERYGYSQKEIAGQYEELARRGYSSTAALGSMNAMIKASRASGDDLADVVKVTAQAVDAFGLRTDNATLMMQRSLRVANAMASGADRTAAGFQDMGIAMGYVSGSAKTVGWNVEQTSAAIGELSNRGLEGTRAGTGLRQVINSLIKPTKNASAAFEKAGFSVDDLHTKSGKLKSVDKVFQLINQHTKDMTKTERGAFFKSVFGSTGQAAAQFLAESAGGLKKNDDELTKLIGHIKQDEKTDYIGRLSRKNMQSAQMQIQKLKRTAEAFEYSIGAALLPAVNKVGKEVAKWAVSKDGQRSMKEFSRAAGNVANTVASHTKDIIAFGSGLVKGIKDGYHFVKPLVTGLSKVVGLFNHSKKGSHDTARNLGKMVGIFGTLAVGIKLAKTLFGGIFAISKDTVGTVSRFVTWIRGGTSAQKTLNAELERTNQLLKESVALQEAQYTGGSTKGGSATADVADTVADVADIAEGRGGTKVVKDSEKLGEKSVKFWKRGWLGKVGNFSKNFFAKLNPRNWTSTMAKLGDKAGKGFHLHLFKHIKGLGSKVKRIFKPRSWTQTFANLGDKAGAKFVKSAGDGIHKRNGKIKFTALFKGGSKVAEKEGGKAGLGWARRLMASVGDARIASKSKWMSFFGMGVTSAEASGTKGAAGFLGKFGGKLAKGAGILGAAWQAASVGIDIVKGIRSHNPVQKQRSYGRAVGTVLGGAAGAALGGPAGAVIGAGIGQAIGNATPNIIKWGKNAAHAFGKGWHNSVTWLGQLITGDFKGVAKGWNNFWGGMGNWFDQTFGVDTGKHPKKHKRKKKPTVTDKIIRTGVHVKKQDVANVKAMSKALKDYAGSLAKVKAQLKKNDPSGELNKVNKFLKSHTKQWTAAAGPIKKIGDAFKYLSKFAASVAKKDAFAAFNRDLPKLDKTLNKHGKSIKRGIDDLTKALKGGGGKHGKTLLQRFQDLGGGLKTVKNRFKDLNKYLDKTASDFKSIKKITDQFTGKKNPFKAMATGLDKLKSALKNDTSEIKDDIKKLKDAFLNKKGKNFAEIIKDAAKPLGNMASSFKSMAKNITPIAKGVKDLTKNIKSLAKGKKGGAISKVAKEFDTLKSHLYKDRGSIKKSLNAIKSALTGKKGFISRVNKANDSIKKLKSLFGSLASNTKSFASNLKTAAGAIKTLAAKKNSLDKLSSSVKDLYNTVKRYKFGSRISSQAHKAAKALTGKASFSSKFKSASSSVKTTEKSVASTFRSLKSSVVYSFKSMWSQVKSNTNSSLDDIVKGINDAVDNINDALDSMEDADKNHKAKHAKNVHFANGTGPLTSSTLGILNDGDDAPEIQNREGILHPDGNLEIPSGRFITRLLNPGTQIIKSSDLSRLLGVRHFASGTFSSIDLRGLVHLERNGFNLEELGKKILKVNSDLLLVSKKNRRDAKKRNTKKKRLKVPQVSEFNPLAYYGSMKTAVKQLASHKSGEKIWLTNTVLGRLGMKSGGRAGGKFVTASGKILHSINNLYERSKKQADEQAKEHKRKVNARKRREAQKQRLLKLKLDREVQEKNARIRRRHFRTGRSKRTSSRSYRLGRLTSIRTSTRRGRSYFSRGSGSQVSVSVSRGSVSAVKALASAIRRLKNKKVKITVSYSGTWKAKQSINRLIKSINNLNKKKKPKISVKYSGTYKAKQSVNRLIKALGRLKKKAKTKIKVKYSGTYKAKKSVDRLTKAIKSLKNNTKSLTKAAKKTKFGTYLSKQAKSAVKSLKGKGNFVKVFKDMVKDFKKELGSMSKESKKQFSSMWKAIVKETKTSERNIDSETKRFGRNFERGFKSLENGVRSTFRHFWSVMKSSAKHGLNGVIDELNRAISSINGVVREFGGSKHAVSRAKRLATGTGFFSGQRKAITKPTLAVLNDGNDSPETGNKETVWTPSTNTFEVVHGRNVPALLKPGQEVFNATESKQLGFTHFASGTGGLKKLYELAKKYWKKPVQTGKAMFPGVHGLTGALLEIAQGIHKRGEDSGVEWWSQLWKMVEDKVDDDNGPASGLLKAVEKIGDGLRYSQSARMSKFAADCSSLVSRALKKYYHQDWAVPNGWALTVAGLWRHAHKISRSQAKPGDPIFWLPDYHVGIYAGHGRYYSAFSKTASPQVGMHSISESVPGVSPTYARFDGLNTEGNKSDNPVVKAKTALQKRIKIQVGKGFWKTIQRIANKFGDSGMASAFRASGDVRHRAQAIAKAISQAVPGATRNGLAAIIGSWLFESGGLNPRAINPSSGASGFGQWLGGRLSSLKAYARRHGKSWTDPATQINFAASQEGIDSSRFRRVARGHGSATELAYEFSRIWERGGYDAQHASAARQVAGLLRGFANGGIARTASIFGEAGPEMAIPLSTDKLARSRELVAQTLAALSENGGNGGQRAQTAQNNQFQAELLDAVKSLAQMVEQLQNKQELVETYINVDGQMLAQKLDKYIRKNQMTHYTNGRMNRSNAF